MAFKNSFELNAVCPASKDVIQDRDASPALVIAKS